MSELAKLKCVACRGGMPTLTDAEIAKLLSQVSNWQVVEIDGVLHLERTFKFGDFVEAEPALWVRPSLQEIQRL